MPSFNPNTLAGLIGISEGGDIGAGGPSAVYSHTPGSPAMTLVQQNAAEEAAARKARLAARNQPLTTADLPQNPYELAAWLQLRPGSGGVPYGDGGRNYWSFDNGLTEQFNSASGPYGQLQAAAVATAPSRAARDIAEIQAAVDLDKNRGQREFAQQLVSSLFGANGLGGPRRTGIATDYGAGVSMPDAPQHVNLAKFRPKSQMAALFG